MFETDKDLPPIQLNREETRELLALEVNYGQLVPDKDEELLKAIKGEYCLSDEQMAPFMDKSPLTRDDIWELQLLKRRSRGNHAAMQVIVTLRAIEAELGVELLRALVDTAVLLQGV